MNTKYNLLREKVENMYKEFWEVDMIYPKAQPTSKSIRRFETLLTGRLSTRQTGKLSESINV